MEVFEEPISGRQFYWADDVRALLREVLDADDGYTLGAGLVERIQRITDSAEGSR